MKTKSQTTGKLIINVFTKMIPIIILLIIMAIVIRDDSKPREFCGRYQNYVYYNLIVIAINNMVLILIFDIFMD